MGIYLTVQPLAVMEILRNLTVLVFAVLTIIFALYGLYDVFRYFTIGSAWFLSRAIAATLLAGFCIGIVQLAAPDSADS